MKKGQGAIGIELLPYAPSIPVLRHIGADSITHLQVKKMQINTTQSDPSIAVKLIRQWKNDASIRAKFENDAGAYFTRAEWDQDENLRDEFAGDFESYAAFSRRA